MKKTRQIKHLPLALIFVIYLCGIWSCGSGGGAAGSDPFTVTSISPMDGATGVGLEINVEIYFSKEADPNTVNSETISIAFAGGTLSLSGTKATYTPSSSLTANTAYTITVTTGVRSSSGLPLDRSYTSGFTTGTSGDNGTGTGGDNIGTGGASCGDGTCTGGETTASCAADCLVEPGDYMWVAGNGGNHAAVFAKSGTSEITNVTAGSNPVAIAADDTYVWVANMDDGAVTRITKSDLTATSITATSADRTLSAIAVDDTYVWVVNLEPAGTLHQVGEGRDDYVTRITKSNTSEIVNIAVGDYPVDVAVDATYVWVLGVDDPLGGGFITRITRSDTSQQTDFAVGVAPLALAVDDDSVWSVSSVPALITRIIKATQVATGMTLYEMPTEIAVDNTHIWLTNLNSDTVTRFTKSDMSEQATINVGDGPRGISLDDTYVWVVNSGDGTVTRITKANVPAPAPPPTKSDSVTTAISVGGYPPAVTGGDPVFTSKGDATGYYYDHFF